MIPTSNVLYLSFWRDVIRGGLDHALPKEVRCYLVGGKHVSADTDERIAEFECLDDLFSEMDFRAENVCIEEDELGDPYLSADDVVFAVEGHLPRPVYGVLLAADDGRPIALWVLERPIDEGYSLYLSWFGSVEGKGGKIVSLEFGQYE